MSGISWEDGDRFVLGERRFHTLPPEAFTKGADLDVGEREFFIFKPRSLVERHIALVDEIRPQYIFELGFFGGGSTAFFTEVARPKRIVAIDRLPLERNRAKVQSFAADRGLADAVRIFGEVDQADRRRLAEIMVDAFGSVGLDLVVDDCSHLYEPTLASFNELFPRLRPGGVYVIEDWRWAHTPIGEEPVDGLFPDQVPLTRLLFEIVLAIAGMPDLITEVAVEPGMAVVRRGTADVDPATFDLTACSNPRGRDLLASI
jgi:SAM-dependent methyltransferase